MKINLINLIIELGFTQYWIAKTLGVPRKYVHMWLKGTTPGPLYSALLLKIVNIINDYLDQLELEELNEKDKKRIQLKYKEFTTTPMYVVLKDRYPIRSTSYFNRELNTFRKQ